MPIFSSCNCTCPGTCNFFLTPNPPPLVILSVHLKNLISIMCISHIFVLILLILTKAGFLMLLIVSSRPDKDENVFILNC